MADFFISYTSTDSYWAHWIGKELSALGHVPHVHEWEVEGGGDIYGWMEKRLDAADHVLCVISDEYLKAPYSSLERNAALWRAAGNKPGFVLFVAVKPARLPALRIIFGGASSSAWTKRQRAPVFANSCKSARRPETDRLPGTGVRSLEIPFQVPAHFIGRDDALAAIEAALRRATGGLAVAALYGLRGVGKTTLPPLMRSAIATIIVRHGGSGRRPRPACAPTSSRSAYGCAGSAPTTRSRRRWRP